MSPCVFFVEGESYRLQDIQLGAGHPAYVRSLAQRICDKWLGGTAPRPLAFPGGDRGGATPVPMPNTAVKPSTADGTARATVWESRSLPGLF